MKTDIPRDEHGWPKLSKLLKPRRGEHIALVHEPMGDFMQLIHLDQLFVIMSDSKPDKKSCEKYLEEAYGDILMLGFGVGLVTLAIQDMPQVKSLTVLEIEPEVIDLIASQLPLNNKVKIVIGDALLYKPDKLYDRIFWDIDPPAERIRELELQGIGTEPESHFRPYLKPGGKVILWNGDRRLYG